LRISEGTNIKKITISLLLFIFGVIIQAWAAPPSGISNIPASNSFAQTPFTKEGLSVTSEGASKEAVRTLEKMDARFQSGISPKDDKKGVSNAESQVNSLLESLEGKKKLTWAYSIDKVIFPYKFDQSVWRNKFLEPQKNTEKKSLNSEFGESMLKPYPNGNEDFEIGKTFEIYKLLNPKRAEIFTEIFMLFHLLFNPKSKHTFLEINSTPFSEKGKGLFIPF
jgi:hypothetical protein